MRSQVVALIFVALIASSQCQATCPAQECLTNAFSLGETIRAFIDKKDWSDMEALKVIITKIQQAFIPCASLIKSLKAAPAPAPLGVTLNANCISQIMAATQKIIAAKGKFTGGLNFDLVLSGLISIGQNTQALKAACM